MPPFVKFQHATVMATGMQLLVALGVTQRILHTRSYSKSGSASFRALQLICEPASGFVVPPGFLLSAKCV